VFAYHFKGALMKKSKVITLIMAAISSIQLITGMQERILYKLDSKLIKGLDGIAHILGGTEIRDIMRMITRIDRMHYGVKNNTIKRHTEHEHDHAHHDNHITRGATPTGYLFNDELLPIKELALVETQFGSSISSENKQLLNQCLENAIHDFMDITFSFLGKIKTFKHIIVNLMQQECKLREKPKSLILTWANASGNEEAVFKASIKNLNDFDSFLTDLTDFLFDFVYSCPKGCAKFKKAYPDLYVIFERLYPEETYEIFSTIK
jgi:hypothetical protein